MILNLPIKASVGRDSRLLLLILTAEQVERVRAEIFGAKEPLGPLGIGIKVGEAKWNSALFARKNGSFALPIRKDVLDREKIALGDLVPVELSARHKRAA